MHTYSSHKYMPSADVQLSFRARIPSVWWATMLVPWPFWARQGCSPHLSWETDEFHSCCHCSPIYNMKLINICPG